MFTQAVKDHLKNDEYLHLNGDREKNDRFTPVDDGVQGRGGDEGT